MFLRNCCSFFSISLPRRKLNTQHSDQLELPGPDIPDPKFWNTGSSGIDICVCKVDIENVNSTTGAGRLLSVRSSDDECIFIHQFHS